MLQVYMVSAVQAITAFVYAAHRALHMPRGSAHAKIAPLLLAFCMWVNTYTNDMPTVMVRPTEFFCLVELGLLQGYNLVCCTFHDAHLLQLLLLPALLEATPTVLLRYIVFPMHFSVKQ